MSRTAAFLPGTLLDEAVVETARLAHGRYRPEIDGLRAVAVLPVILFHAGISVVSGGFVGVDVFFVISGYLITSILHRELSEGRFSILTFYERRLRRIIPNLLAMIVASTLVAAVLLIPADLKLYAESVVAALAFVANVLFWLKIGYFAPSSSQLPLLHTWSLGVEEQYYVMFPLLLLVAMRIRGHRALVLAIGAVFAVSLGVSVVQTRLAPEAALYLPFARLFELMTGSLLAVGAIPSIANQRLREGLAAGGLAAMMVAVFGFTDRTSFPGFAALLPCLGTAAILHGTSGGLRQTAVGRLLSTRGPVFIGAISYSLYLWHWPLVVFARYALQRDLRAGEIAVLLIVTFAVAILAWAAIERPLRARTVPVRRLLFASGAVGALLAGTAGAMIAANGLPQRYAPSIRGLALATEDVNPRRLGCDRPGVRRLNAGQVCTIGTAGAEPTFALLGDSFGDALAPGIGVAADRAGVTGLVLTHSGCMPLPGMNARGSTCRDVADATVALIRRVPSIRNVIVVGRWPALVSGDRMGLFRDHVVLQDDKEPGTDGSGNVDVVARGLERLIRAVAPARVTIITGMPEQLVHVPQATTVRALFGGAVRGVSRQAYDIRQRQMRMLLARLHRRVAFSVVDLGQEMCGPSECPILQGGSALYVDDNHPAASYTRDLAGPLIRAVMPDNGFKQAPTAIITEKR